MLQSRKQLLAEVTLAAAFGLVAEGIHVLGNAASASHGMPRVFSVPIAVFGSMLMSL
jgi:ribulose 1,5-bisphosphate synthetase/thiazole synthase